MSAARFALFALLSAVATPAVAGPGHGHGWGPPHRPAPPPPPLPVSELRVDNETGAPVDVWIDGAHRGQVRLGDERGFSTAPGRHTVRVVTTWGVEAFQGVVTVLPTGSVELDVGPPVATLRLTNDGAMPLYVTVPGSAPFWMLPGASQIVTVPAGFAPVTTMVYGARGYQTVGTWQVATPGGQLVSQSIGYAPLPPTSTITLTNHERSTVRVYVAGRELAAVPAGATQTFEVGAGRHLVTIVEHRGGVLYNGPVTVDPRKDHHLRVEPGYRVADALTATSWLARH